MNQVNVVKRKMGKGFGVPVDHTRLEPGHSQFCSFPIRVRMLGI